MAWPRAKIQKTACWKDPPLGAPTWDEVAAALVGPEAGLCARSARFTAADVVEHVCALSGGRLGVEEVVTMAERFLACELVVHLTPDPEEARRRPAQWSTAAHRAMEDRTLALIGALIGRQVPGIEGTVLEAALDAEPGLGEDQAAAVKVLAGEGGGLRAVLAPAGYGKTTMLHAAAQAATGDGRPVVAVATTAKAVAELAGAGLDSRTIARLRVDLAHGPLAAGTVVVLDEVSQTPTRDVETVLAALDACPGGSVWVLGDPRQSQPVGAGGIADHIERLANEGLVPSARLTVNRRQVDPADQEALGMLRRGEAAASQHLRTEHGWEHELTSPCETRRALADAICTDIGRYGAEQIAALVVSHGDAEDLADGVRARLGSAGALAGPALAGPGWTTEREYQAGDRVLLHARCGRSGSPAVHGATGTVTAGNSDGLAVRLDGSGETMSLPAAFVQGTRKDGSPNLSHAWARTVDGAQGGTWEACHLLGSATLDAYRGYTGQSRSRQPTHTWNTARVAVVDHGGALADQRGAAEQVAGALARRPDPSLAARSDPWVLDSQLRAWIAEHERVLAARPPDRRQVIVAATKDLQAAESRLADREATASHTAGQLAAVGALAGLTRRGREQRRWLQNKLASEAERAAVAKDSCNELASRTSHLRREQDVLHRFEAAEGWRREDISRLRAGLTTTGPKSSPPACKQTTLSHTGSTNSATLAPPRPGTCGTSTPGSRSTVPPNATTRSGSWPMPKGGDNKPNRRWRAHAPPSTRAGAFGGDVKASRRSPRPKAGVDFAEQRLEQAAGVEDALWERFGSLARHQQQRQRGRGGGRRAQTAQRHLGAVRRRPRPHSSRPGALPGRRPAGPSGRAARASAGLTRRSRRVVPPRPWYRGCPRPQRRLGRAAHRPEPGHGTSPAGRRHRRPAVAIHRRRG